MSRISWSHRQVNQLLFYFSLFLICTSLTTAQSITTNVDTSTCGVTKACWRQPSGCQTGTCKYLLTWKNDGNGQSVSFEIEGEVSSSNSWLAVGLSKDLAMGSDSVVDCVYNSQTSSYTVESSWNNIQNNQPLSNPQLVLVPGSTSAAYLNGHLVCRYQRLIGTGGSSQVYALDSYSYYPLMAFGPAANGFTSFHGPDRVAPSVVYNFTGPPISSASDTSLSVTSITVHGYRFPAIGMLLTAVACLLA